MFKIWVQNVLLFSTVLVLILGQSRSAPTSDSTEFYHFRAGDDTFQIPLVSPRKFAEGVFSGSSADDYIQLATVSGTSMDPTTFSGASFIGYDSRSGSPVLRSAFEDVGQLSVVEQTYSERRYAMVYDAKSQENINKVAVGVGGAFMGVGIGIDVSSATEMKTVGKSVQVRALLRQDIRTERIPTLDTVVLKSDALNLMTNDPTKFMEQYGTHAIVSKTYGCMSSLDGLYTFSSTEKTDVFKTSLKAGLDVGIFSVGVSTDIENKVKQTDSKSTFRASLQGDVTDIRPKGATNLTAWAEALQEEFQSKCQGITGTSVKYVTALSWGAIARSMRNSGSFPKVSISIKDAANIALGNRKNGVVLEGYNTFITTTSAFGIKQWAKHLGPGGCYNATIGEREELLGPHEVLPEMKKQKKNVVKPWLPAEASSKFASLSRTDLAMYALKYATVRANANVFKYVNLVNQGRAFFVLSFPSRKDFKPVTFNIYNLNFKVCFQRKTNKFTMGLHNIACPFDKSDPADSALSIELNTDLEGESGILSYNVETAEKIDTLGSGTLKAYETTNISLGGKKGQVTAYLEPLKGLKMEQIGYVPCTFRV